MSLRHSTPAVVPGAAGSTLDRGDAAMGARFGHVRGAFADAIAHRPGLLGAAGRILFAPSRARGTRVNDADRLPKSLARFGLALPGR